MARYNVELEYALGIESMDFDKLDHDDLGIVHAHLNPCIYDCRIDANHPMDMQK